MQSDAENQQMDKKYDWSENGKQKYKPIAKRFKQ
jgi:hypothetical protein